MTTRRDLLTGIGAVALTGGHAQAQSLAGLARGTNAIIAETAPVGRFGYVLIDYQSGKIIEEMNADSLFIPASLSKIPTSFTAMRVHGPRADFVTTIRVSGPIDDGVLDGDLSLIGGGDPSLDTHGLVELAQQLQAAGITKVSGRFRYDTAALPSSRWLDKRQPWQAPYNPSMGGLNLNYNRVQFRWAREGAYLRVRGASVSDGKVMPAPSIQFRVTREGDEMRHDIANGVETWTLRESLLTDDGNRWLPVRAPGAYTAGVFQQVCAEFGIDVPAPQASTVTLRGRKVAEYRSKSVYEMLRGMMQYSNNLTAEALGASAGSKDGGKPDSIIRAAGLTARRTAEDVGGIGGEGWNGFSLENHSGLSIRSRATPRQLAHILRDGKRRWGDPYVALFNSKTMNAKRLGLPPGIAAPDHSIYGKTGSMHFVRGLAGFLTVKDRPMVYAFIANEDTSRRILDAQFTPYGDPAPSAAANWSRRTKVFERSMLRDWVLRYSS